MTGNTKKVTSFIKGCNDFEFTYAFRLINYVSQVREIVKKHNITKEEFCTRLRLVASDYKRYLNGTYPYSIDDMVFLELLWQEKEKLKVEKDKQLLKTPKNDKS